MTATARGDLAFAELRLRLGALLRGVKAAADRQAGRGAALARPEISGLAITAQHAQVLLAEAEALVRDGREYGPGADLSPADARRLDEIRARAAAAGLRIPSAILADRGLGHLEQQILLLAAAPEIDPLFGSLYAYLHDARAAGSATAHLAVQVLATSSEHERLVAEACGPFGILRGDGWLLAAEPDRGALTPLRPAVGVAELLRGSGIDPDLVARRCDLPAAGPLPAGMPAETTAALADALADGRVDVVGVWGPPGRDTAAVAAALLAGRHALRAGPSGLAAALQRAALAGACCVVDVPPDDPQAASAVADAVTASSARVLLTGPEPLRATALMAGRRYAEIRVPAPGFADRRESWAAAFPWLPGSCVDDLAARFRLSRGEISAVAALDQAARGWAGAGRPAIGDLAGMVSRRRSSRIAAVRTPERRADQLVLPPAELAQVMDIAAATRAWPRIAEAWRLDRFGNPGVTALFAGDPGTGKTLAAEVIAAEVGIDLMVVDLSRLVSKWLGETEKHLDAVFSEAQASSCVLFFDEADAIFGRRGEVTRGTDRYANLEVGYLLQRLERYEGLVILASNLRENLDPAFTRRFHHVVHFPRPAPEQRRRLWEIALAPPVQTALPLDLDLLATLDLTGAGVVAVVRGAALIAAAAGRAALNMDDVVAAASAQFRREARLLPRELLGLLDGLAV